MNFLGSSGFNKRFLLLSSLLSVLGLVVGMAFAQSPADDFARRQSDMTRSRQVEMLRDLTPKDEAKPARDGQSFMPSGGFCFEIDHVDVDGVKSVASQAMENL